MDNNLKKKMITSNSINESNINKHLLDMATKGSISAAGAAGGVIGTFAAKKAMTKIDALIEKRKKQKEKEDNRKSEEKH